MSHISRIEVEIRDLDCLRRACSLLGFQFMTGQNTYKWYGRVMNPELHPLPEGMSLSQLGQCNHAIRVPDAEYEVGVVKHNGKHLLLCDFWDAKLRLKIGENGGRLKQAYAIERTKKEAKRNQLRFSESKIDNGFRITISL